MTLEIWSTLITLVAVAVAALIAVYAWPRYRPLSLIMPLWLAAAWLLSRRGFFANATDWTSGDFIGFLAFGTLMTLPIILFFVARRQSPAFARFLTHVPLPAIIGIQVYRLAGAIFWWMLVVGLVPAALGLSTAIADVIVGALALPLAAMLARGLPTAPQIAYAWNIFGIVDFLAAITIVSLSISGLLTLQPDPVMIGMHPLALIALFQLPLSICLHILALQRLHQPTLQQTITQP